MLSPMLSTHTSEKQERLVRVSADGEKCLLIHFRLLLISKCSLMFKNNDFEIKEMLQIPNAGLKAGCNEMSQQLPKRF